MDILNDITLVIPVRIGSTRIEEKILLPINEKETLLEWKINQLKQIHPCDKIMVSSNSKLVKEISNRLGVRFHQRSDYLSVGHDASFSEVITGVVEAVATNHFGWVTVVVPLMSPTEYLDAMKLYVKNVIESSLNDSLVSVNRVQDYFWTSDGPMNYRADRNHTYSQDLPVYYRVTNGLYMSPKAQALESGYFLGKNPAFHEVDKISGVDIDYMEDYEISKSLLHLYKARQKCD